MAKIVDLFRNSAAPQPPPPGPAVEMHPQAVADADACYRAGRDVGHCTAGTGPVTDLTIAGTPMRQPALWHVAGSHRPPTPDGYVPGVVMREPQNPHDPNAVRVLVDGIHVGYLFAEKAKAWQPVLKEVERRRQLLVGGVRFYGGHGEPLGAAIRLRDTLPGYAGPITKAKKEREKVANAHDVPPRLLQGDEWVGVGRELLRLSKQSPVRTKQHAGLAVKQFRDLLPQLWGHAHALEAAADGPVPAFGDLLEDAEGGADSLLADPEDADEREDLHTEWQGTLEDLTNELRRHGQNG